jgi:hypothetical protein
MKVKKKLSEVEKVKSKARTIQLDKLYEIATSPSSTRNDLKKAWDSTKSSKVRRAIAMHGNADVNIMKMSARLYVKEVLNNPSFELMRLFDEDPFITALKACYEDPKKAVNSRVVYNTGYKDRSNLIRAMLLSPQLDYSTLVGHILQNLSSTDFKRELGDKDVYDRIKDLITKNCIEPAKRGIKKVDIDSLIRRGYSNSQRVSDFFTFYKAGFLSKQEIYNLVYMVGIHPRSNYGSNSIAVNLIADALKDGDVENATKLMLCGNYSTPGSIAKKVSESVQPLPTKLKQLDTYVKCFALMVELFASHDRKNSNDNHDSPIMEPFHCSIYEMITRICLGSSKKSDLEKLDKDELIAIHNCCVSTGFEKYASYYMPRYLVLKDKDSLYSLNQCPQQTIDFYVKNNLISSKISCSASVDKIVKTLEDINESGSLQEMIFVSMRVDYFKSISYDTSMLRGRSLATCGLDLRLLPCKEIPAPVLVNLNTGFASIPYPSTNPFVLNLLGKAKIMEPLLVTE